MQPTFRSGLAYLETATDLLQRIRRAHPTAGLFEAADLQWWWRVPRATDELPQLFWLDADGRPVAGIVATDWGEDTSLDPAVMPDVDSVFVAHVVTAGLAHAEDLSLGKLSLEVDSADVAMQQLLTRHGFTAEEVGMVESWIDVTARPEVSALADGYRISTRADAVDTPHHMIHAGRNHPDAEPRLLQTSLYRPDLDLVVHAPEGAVAAYGLFWLDPVSSTGLVEPMRTETDHQRRGLARRLLTDGLDRLAAAGAERVKICFEVDNSAARDLYLSVGFEPARRTVIYSRDPNVLSEP